MLARPVCRNDTEPNKLYRNNHDGTFSDVAVTAGVAFSESHCASRHGVDAGDYDGSGKPGLIIGNFTNESMALYRNEGTVSLPMKHRIQVLAKFPRITYIRLFLLRL